jgi:hypothetical protein
MYVKRHGGAICDGLSGFVNCDRGGGLHGALSFGSCISGPIKDVVARLATYFGGRNG